MLFLPPRIFLDTNHLVELTRLARGENRIAQAAPRRAAYGTLLQMMGSGVVTVLTVFDQAFEWGRRHLQDAQQLAAFLDHLSSLLDVAPQDVTFFVEAVEELRRLSGELVVPEAIPTLVVPLSECGKAMGFFGRYYRGPFADEIHERIGAYRVASVADRVRASTAARHAEDTLFPHWQINAERHADVTRAQLKREHRRMPDHARRDWLTRQYGLDVLLRETMAATRVTDLLAEMQTSRMRSFDVYADVYLRFLKGSAQLSENDFGDLVIVHASVYSDFALIEKHFAELIGQAATSMRPRVFSDPVRFVDAVQNASTPSTPSP